MKFSTRINFQLVKLSHFFILFFIKLKRKDTTKTYAKRAGIYWQLNLDEVIDFLIYLTGGFDKKSITQLQQKIQEGDIVIDIGANIGSMALPFAQAVGKHGKVYAIEPSDYAFERMQKNCALNPSLSKQVHPFQCFVTSGNQKPTEVYASWNMTQSHNRHKDHMGNPTTTQGATAMSLDAFVQWQQIPKIDWLKIDVDGYECEVLSGAIDTLKKHQPKIFIELSEYPLIERGKSLAGMLNYLFDAGYQIYDMHGNKLGKDLEAIRKLIPTMGATNAFAFAY